MFNLSWGEMLMIGAVALIVIGPKELPGALRTLGRVIGKARRMAGDFQSQFNEALREADLDQVRRDVEGFSRTASNVSNPARMIRDEVKGAIDGPAKKPAAFKPGAPKPSAPGAAASSDAATAKTDSPAPDNPGPTSPAPGVAPATSPPEISAPTADPVRQTPKPATIPTGTGAPDVQPDPVRTEEKST
ncbi:MAG: Sec-independent protein translocase protein TatB [Microvirga sp.]|nr:Sec-independent protein translocase protein TatB [Microvirga sp.]